MGLAPWNRLKPPSKIFLLTVPRRYFFCGSFILFLSCVCYAYVCVCLLMHCGHLLGKSCPLGSRLWCPVVSLLLPFGILGQVWYLILSIPDRCPLFYFKVYSYFSTAKFLLWDVVVVHSPNDLNIVICRHIHRFMDHFLQMSKSKFRFGLNILLLK